MRWTLLIISLIVYIHSKAWAAPPKPRPLAGIGIISLDLRSGNSSIPVYREPGVARMTQLELSESPAMAPVVNNPSEGYLLAVTRKKGEWLRVIIDDSGREGWIEQNRKWEFRTWESCLKGREVSLLNGIRKEYFQLKKFPVSSSQTVETVSRDRKLRVVELENSWMLVLVDFSQSGWLRWKDDDGRLLITFKP